MSDATDIAAVEETTTMKPPVPTRLAAAGGEPAGTAVEAVLAAVREGKITSKLAREVLVRLIPPAKPPVTLRLPVVRDAKFYAAVTQAVLRADTAGKIAPSDAILLQRGIKVTRSIRRTAWSRASSARGMRRPIRLVRMRSRVSVTTRPPRPPGAAPRRRRS